MKKVISILLILFLNIGFLVNSVEADSLDEMLMHKQQEARDTLRVFNLQKLQLALEQFYQDNGMYPDKSNFKDILIYVNGGNIPKDSFLNEEISGCEFGYIYEVGDDGYGSKNGNYKISSCLELDTYIKSRALKDGGTYDNRLELGSFSWDINKNAKFKQRFFINNPDKEIEDKETKQKIKTGDFKITKTKLHLLKQVIISKGNLNKTRKGRKYVDQVELIIEKLSKTKLQKLYTKLGKLPQKTRFNKKYKNLLDYIEGKIGIVLLK